MTKFQSRIDAIRGAALRGVLIKSTMTQSQRYMSQFLLLVLLLFRTTTYAQTAPPAELNADSLRAEILRLRTDLDDTQANLRTSHRKFRTGILVSGIGYTVTIIGGVLLGSQDYSDWGQPLVLAGGVIGFSGAILLLNSNRFIGRAGGMTAQGPSVPNRRATGPLSTDPVTNRAP